MPLLIAPLVALSIGLFLGLRSPGALGARGAAAARACVAWLAALAFFPAVAVASLCRPAWATLHVLADSSLPSFALLLASGAAASVLVLGYRLGRSLALAPRDRGPRLPALTALIPAAFALLVLLAMRERLALLEPAHGRAAALPLAGSRFALAPPALLGLLAIATLLTTRALDELADASPREGARLGRGPRAGSAGRAP